MFVNHSCTPGWFGVLDLCVWLRDIFFLPYAHGSDWVFAHHASSFEAGWAQIVGVDRGSFHKVQGITFFGAVSKNNFYSL